MMPSIGPMEVLIVAIIALLVLGPKKLPDAGRSLGRGIKEFKGAITGGNSSTEPAADVDHRI
jgi:sec-independent protein translocase protein TatA